MINREMRPVLVVSFTSGTDAYGQKRKGGSTKREVQMVTKIYNQVNVVNVRYTDVTMIGLTYDDSITDENQIEFDGAVYDVLYVIPSGRLHQVLMKKV